MAPKGTLALAEFLAAGMPDFSAALLGSSDWSTSRLVVLSLSLALPSLSLLACGSQESPKEATKDKMSQIAAMSGGASTLQTSEAYIKQGKEFLKAKQCDQAIVSLSEAIKLDPQSIQAYTGALFFAIKGTFKGLSMISAAPSRSTPSSARATPIAPWLTT